MKVLVTGAGGFIGGHLVNRLHKEGHDIRAVDIASIHDWHQVPLDVECVGLTDLRLKEHCEDVMVGCDRVYHLAADMGGIGFIENHLSDCMLNILITTNLLLAADKCNVQRFLYTSSACVYPLHKQQGTDNVFMAEQDAYPANPENGYGWEKLFGERMCINFSDDGRVDTRIARFHNIYGPLGTYKGGREKAPAAICRKVVECVLDGSDEIEIWGTGQQRRSFLYITDCIDALVLLMGSDYRYPLNIGSEEVVSIDEIVSMVESAASVSLKRKYLQGAPIGVASRGSDNKEVQRILGWSPSVPLRTGVGILYEWVKSQMERSGA